MKRILFQGDSITDCARVRAEDTHVGTGYAFLVKAQLRNSVLDKREAVALSNEFRESDSFVVYTIICCYIRNLQTCQTQG